jgi:hypothetical protein
MTTHPHCDTITYRCRVCNKMVSEEIRSVGHRKTRTIKVAICAPCAIAALERMK